MTGTFDGAKYAKWRRQDLSTSSMHCKEQSLAECHRLVVARPPEQLAAGECVAIHL
jgi:hypothetical protein